MTMMRRSMRWCPGLTVIAAVLAVVPLADGPAQAADSGARAVEITPPAPDWDNPRRILLQVTAADPARFEGVMSNAMNLRAFYGPDEVKLAILTYGAGVRNLLRDSATAPDRVTSLRAYDVEFIACGNTLDAIGKSEADLVDGVTVVSAGIAELVERQLRGWVTVVP